MMENKDFNFDRLAAAKQILDEGFVVPEDVGFSYCGQWIQNPFYDETYRFGVKDPREYYGAENVERLVGRILEEAAKAEKAVRADVVWFRLSEDFCVSVWHVPDKSLGDQLQMKLELVGEDGKMGPACELVHDEAYGTADLSHEAIHETLREVVQDAVFACDEGELDGVCMDGLVDVSRLAKEIQQAFGPKEEKETKERANIVEVLEDAKVRSQETCSSNSIATEQVKE